METQQCADSAVNQQKEGAWNKLLNLFFPRKCTCCGKILAGGALCGTCLQTVRLLQKPELARPQGSALDGLAACFVYSGAGAALMRAFKFHRQEHCYELVLRQPFEACAKTLYAGVHIDLVAAVPMYPATKRERGFNQAEYIARRLALGLALPYDGDALRKTKKNRVQHSLCAEDRAQNVKNVYQAGGNLAGKTVLLVDDITTTGSTLEECAVALKKAGAAHVFGIAAEYTP